MCPLLLAAGKPNGAATAATVSSVHCRLLLHLPRACRFETRGAMLLLHLSLLHLSRPPNQIDCMPVARLLLAQPDVWRPADRKPPAAATAVGAAAESRYLKCTNLFFYFLPPSISTQPHPCGRASETRAVGRNPGSGMTAPLQAVKVQGDDDAEQDAERFDGQG